MDQKLLEDLVFEEKTHWWHVAKRRMLLAWLPRTAGRVLVLGIGGGLLCGELKALGWQVTGLDISAFACRAAQERYGVETIEYDLERGLPFQEKAFDCVIAADVIEHIGADRVLVEEIARVLKGGGTFLATVPAYPHLWSRWDERLGHKRRYEAKGFRMLFQGSGLAVRKMSFTNVLIYPAAFLRRKMFGMVGGDTSDFSIAGGRVVGAVMAVYYAVERFGVKTTGFPFGLALFGCFRKE